jgi:hypothetical protein
MIDLSSDKFQERERATIFNNGVAGKVENVTLELQKKQATDAPGSPDYKLFAVDENGAKVNAGFYHQDSDKMNDLLLGRVLHVAKAVLGKDYEFPKTYENHKVAVDTLFKLIKNNLDDKKFNVFTTYGSVGYPSQYLGLRYFEFIEPASVPTEETRLFPKLNSKDPSKNDLMERIVPDAANNKQAFPNEEVQDSKDESWV